MSRVEITRHGVWCYICQEVHDGTDGCEHRLENKDGLAKHDDGYITTRPDMGHYSPCMFFEVDGFEQCGECGATKIPSELVETNSHGDTVGERDA